MSKDIAQAAREVFDAAQKIVVDGIARVEWAHPMLAEFEAKRVVSYKEDLELLSRIAKDGDEADEVALLIRQFENLEREAGRNVQIAHARAARV